jgi:hypothetical protein
MADTKTTTESAPTDVKKTKGLPGWLIAIIGCFGCLTLVGIVLSVAGGVIFSKLGVNLLQKGIAAKTGISLNTEEGKEGISFTDSKTGTEVNIGEGKIPTDFPKDFPLYPGAKAVGNLAGTGKGETQKGFWIIFSTTDAATKVVDYFTKNLKSNGWVTENTMNLGDVTTIQVKKGTSVGTVTVSTDKEKKETSIMVTVNPSDEAPSQSSKKMVPTETMPTDEETTDQGSM